jgi:hypothetical protein
MRRWRIHDHAEELVCNWTWSQRDQLPGCHSTAVRTDEMADRSVAPWGVERPGRAVRFVRLIHAARPRSWRTCGPGRLRRQSQPPWLHEGDAVA